LLLDRLEFHDEVNIVNNSALNAEEPQPQGARLERERIHFNKIATRNFSRDLIMPVSNLRRYESPSADTPFPLEYAFHLLGNVRGKTIVDLGCGEGLNTVLLAALGAHVISVDISDQSLELTGKRAEANGVDKNVTLIHSNAMTIPVNDAYADGVLCAAILHHVDCIVTARQIRRILKPGGIASFLEPVTGTGWFSKFKSFIPKPEHVSDDERPLTPEQIRMISRCVGKPGRSRHFMVSTRLLARCGVHSFAVIKKSHELDAWLLRRFPFTRALASPVVWEARKER
jgi:2-polyprenyl-3-methyl-5-hydroxy-6-metoxy-1,4-benzoquinol methylase